MLTHIKKGYLRDKELMVLLSPERCWALNTDQIKLLLFRNTSLQFAQDRLRRLWKKGILRRDRFSANEPYCYWHTDYKRPRQVEHLLGVNWVYAWYRLNLGQWERLHSYQRELDYKVLRADGLIAINNLIQKALDFTFVEFDCIESGNAFKKVSQYNAFYLSEGYQKAWWGKVANKFPRIHVVTTGPKKRIELKIAKENIADLRFKVSTLQEIKEECFKWLKPLKLHSDHQVQGL